jgi:predicted Holliday junction resolvase-like endonuclease
MTYIYITLISVAVGFAVYLYLELKRVRAEAESFIREKAQEFIDVERELEDTRRELSMLNYKLELSERNPPTPDLNGFINKETYQELLEQYRGKEARLSELEVKHSEFVSKRKSQEVRLGAIAETLTPFLAGFPYNPKNLRALGSPIDYVAFEEDEIVFIEVKSGDSATSKKQKNIKRIVEEGNVRFEVHRINEGGLKVE